MKKILIMLLLSAAMAFQVAYAAPSQSAALPRCPIGDDYDCGDNVSVAK